MKFLGSPAGDPESSMLKPSRKSLQAPPDCQSPEPSALADWLSPQSLNSDPPVYPEFPRPEQLGSPAAGGGGGFGSSEDHEGGSEDLDAFEIPGVEPYAISPDPKAQHGVDESHDPARKRPQKLDEITLERFVRQEEEASSMPQNRAAATHVYTFGTSERQTHPGDRSPGALRARVRSPIPGRHKAMLSVNLSPRTKGGILRVVSDPSVHRSLKRNGEPFVDDCRRAHSAYDDSAEGGEGSRSSSPASSMSNSSRRKSSLLWSMVQERKGILTTASTMKLNGLQQPEFKDRREVHDEALEELFLSTVTEMLSSPEEQDIAYKKLEQAVENAYKYRGSLQKARACASIAELLNRWAATKGSYTRDIMVPACSYSRRAVEELDRHLPPLHAEVETSLYWCGLNFATVSAIPNDTWPKEKALEVFHECLHRLQEIHKENQSLEAEGEAVIHFLNGILEFNHGKSDKAHFEIALELFAAAYEVWRDHYTEIHPRTVTAITMIAACYRIMGYLEESILWAYKDLKVRERLHTRHHPRTKQAQQVYDQLIAQGEGAQGSASVPEAHQTIIEPEEVLIDEIVDWQIPLYSPETGWKSDEWMLGALLTMFQHSGCLDFLLLGADEFLEFLVLVRFHHEDQNDFHNFKHVFNVVHAAFLIGCHSDASKYLRPQDTLVILLSSLCHDIDHPGVNNDFLIKSASPIANLYPRPSCLEEHHVTEALYVMEETGVLRNLSPSMQAEVHNGIRVAVMATFMGAHAALVDRLRNRNSSASQNARPFDVTVVEDRIELIETIVHAADLSNQVLAKPVALEFGKMVMMEFHKQYIREKAERMEVTPFMSNLHDVVQQAKCQLGFLVYVCSPLWRALVDTFPDLIPCYQKIEERILDIDLEKLDKWNGVNWDIVRWYDTQHSKTEDPGAQEPNPKPKLLTLSRKS